MIDQPTFTEQVKMGVHIGSNVNAIVHKVDRITDDMHAVRHNMDKMIQDDRLQDSQPRLSEVRLQSLTPLLPPPLGLCLIVTMFDVCVLAVLPLLLLSVMSLPTN